MPRFDLPYVKHPDAEARRASAIRLAQVLVATDGIHPSHRRHALTNAVWWYTEADGKLKVRYRSSGVLAGGAVKVHHEHVVPRKNLVDRMLADPDAIPEILASAVACLVTVEEHRRLTALPPSVEGWDRYRAAGVEVRDMLDGTPAW